MRLKKTEEEILSEIDKVELISKLMDKYEILVEKRKQLKIRLRGEESVE